MEKFCDNEKCGAKLVSNEKYCWNCKKKVKTSSENNNKHYDILGKVKSKTRWNIR